MMIRSHQDPISADLLLPQLFNFCPASSIYRFFYLFFGSFTGCGRSHHPLFTCNKPRTHNYTHTTLRPSPVSAPFFGCEEGRVQSCSSSLVRQHGCQHNHHHLRESVLSLALCAFASVCARHYDARPWAKSQQTLFFLTIWSSSFVRTALLLRLSYRWRELQQATNPRQQ